PSSLSLYRQLLFSPLIITKRSFISSSSQALPSIERDTTPHLPWNFSNSFLSAPSFWAAADRRPIPPVVTSPTTAKNLSNLMTSLLRRPRTLSGEGSQPPTPS